MVGKRADIQPMVDAFTLQNLRHPLVFSLAKIVFGSTEYNLHVVELVILRIGNKIGWIVKKHVVIVVATQMLFDVKSATHAEHIGHFIGVFERKIQSVVPAKAATSYSNFVHITLLSNRRNQFVIQHPIVAGVIVQAGGGVQMFGVPAIAINAIDAVYFDFSRLNEPTSGFDEFEILVFVVPPHGGGKKQDWIAPIPKSQHFDVSSQTM